MSPEEPVDAHPSHTFEYQGDQPARCTYCGVWDYYPIAEQRCPGTLRRQARTSVSQSHAEISMARELRRFFSEWAHEPELPTLAEWRANWFEWSRTTKDDGTPMEICSHCDIVKEMKQCNACRQWKPLDAYHASKAHAQGRQPRCKECRKSQG